MVSIIKEYINQSKKIKKDERFNNLYNRLKENLSKIELKKNKSNMALIKAYTILAVIAFIVIIINKIVAIPQTVNLVIIFAAVIIVFIGIIEFLGDKQEYISEYKLKCLMEVIRNINDGAEYFSKEPGINISIYNEAKFEGREFNNYKSSDYIRIKNKDIIIHLSNMKLNQIVYKDMRQNVYNIFNGIYCYVPINKNVERIYIKKSLQNLITKHGQINIDDETFEKYFNVFSNNQVLTMQVLKPQVMETMLEFIKKCFIDFEIIIQGDKIHFKFYNITISSPEFSSLNNSEKKQKRILYYYYNIFQFVIKMTEYLSKILNELEI